MQWISPASILLIRGDVIFALLPCVNEWPQMKSAARIHEMDSHRGSEGHVAILRGFIIRGDESRQKDGEMERSQHSEEPVEFTV
jgi:hypothetical protein